MSRSGDIGFYVALDCALFVYILRYYDENARGPLKLARGPGSMSHSSSPASAGTYHVTACKFSHNNYYNIHFIFAPKLLKRKKCKLHNISLI